MVTVKVLVVYPDCIVVLPDTSVVQSPVIVVPERFTDLTLSDTVPPDDPVDVVADVILDAELVPIALIDDTRYV